MAETFRTANGTNGNVAQKVLRGGNTRAAAPIGTAAFVALVLLMSALVVEFVIYVQVAIADPYFDPGMDFVFYRDVGIRWLADGSYYLPGQLQGPYEVTLMADVLYPPSALLLFVPFAFLPAILWWAVPLGIIGYALYRWQPPMRALVAIVLLLMWPGSLSVIVYGNTNLWIAAGVAGGLLWGWPAALVLLKPSLAPLALVGVRHRSWWVSLAGLTVLGLATFPMWLEYLQTMRDAQGLGLSYVLWGLPILAVPVVAYASRYRPSARSRTRD